MDEVPLILRAMHVMDGGFSAKRTVNAGLVDQQKFYSSYLISHDYMNLFKDEVKKRKPPEPAPTAEVSNHLSMYEVGLTVTSTGRSRG